MAPRWKAKKKAVPPSCRETGRPCTTENRCAAHEIHVDPESLGELLRRLLGGAR